VQSRPGLADVAQLAETSSSTVSRVLSGRGVVSKATAERVKRALEATGFVLNQRRSIAGRLRHTPRALRYGVIGVVVFADGHGGRVNVHPHENVRSMVLDGVLCAADKAGVRVHVGRAAWEDLERGAVPPSLSGAQLDGILSQSMPGNAYEVLEEVAPLVFFGNHPSPSCPVPSVEPETSLSVDAIIQHLHEQGHRRYAFVADRAGRARSHLSLFMRQRAFSDSVAARECAGEIIEMAGPNDLDSVLAACSNRPAGERPTALVCSNDGLATLVLAGLATRGVRVPADVSVTGFDGLSVGEVVFPALTTWAPDWTMVGRLSFEALLARAKGETAPLRTLVGGELRVRGSTGRAAGPSAV